MVKKLLLGGCLGISLVALFVFWSIQKSCRATWFKPVGLELAPMALQDTSCRIDTSGYFSAARPRGFALHFEVEYIAEAAVEPGINGLADSLTAFEILQRDSAGSLHEVSREFYYGLPQGCLSILKNERTGFTAALPDTIHQDIEIQDFMQVFNRISGQQFLNRDFPDTGWQVEYSNFMFWLKPGSFLETWHTLPLEVRIRTASGKKLQAAATLRLRTE